MFSSKSKLDHNLKDYISKNAYKSYRILIQYKDFQSSIVKKSVHIKVLYITLLNPLIL